MLGALLCASVAAAQTQKYGVTVTAQKDVDFAKFKTYSWMTSRPASLKAVDAQIVAAVDGQLAALGMSKSASGPGDVLVTYSSLTRTDADLKSKRDASNQLTESSVGTLVVALLEPERQRELLRLRVDKPIETAPDQLESAIKTAVAEMFARYPTRSK